MSARKIRQQSREKSTNDKTQEECIEFFNKILLFMVLDQTHMWTKKGVHLEMKIGIPHLDHDFLVHFSWKFSSYSTAFEMCHISQR